MWRTPFCRFASSSASALSPTARSGAASSPANSKRPEDLAGDDARRAMPRFQGENFQRNLALVANIEEIARAKGCTPAQLALAWVLSKGKDIVAIPGTKRRRYLDENLGALDIRLTAQDQATLDNAVPPGAAAGLRYSEQGMRTVNL